MGKAIKLYNKNSLVPCRASEESYSGSKLPAELSHEGVNKFMIGSFSSRDLGVRFSKRGGKMKIFSDWRKQRLFSPVGENFGGKKTRKSIFD